MSIFKQTRYAQPQGPVEVDWSDVSETGTTWLSIPDGTGLIANVLNRSQNLAVPGGLSVAQGGRILTFNGSQQGNLAFSLRNNSYANTIIAARVRATATQSATPGAAFGLYSSTSQAGIGIGFDTSNNVGLALINGNGAYLNTRSAGSLNVWYTVFVYYSGDFGTAPAYAYINGLPATTGQGATSSGSFTTPNEIAFGAQHRSSGFLRQFKGDIEWAAILNFPQSVVLDDALAWRLYSSGYPYNLFAPIKRQIWVPMGVGAGGITPPLLTNTSDLFTPAVSVIGGSIALTPPLLTNTSTLYAPTVTPGAISVTPSLLTNSSTLHTPALTVGGTVVQPPLLTNTNDLFAPTLTPGAISVAPPLLPSNNAFFAPVVSVGGTVLQAPLLENTSTPYAPSVGLGAIALGPPLLTNTSTLHTPTVAATGPQTLEPPLLANASTLFAPTVGGVQPLSDAEMRHMYELVQELHASMAGCGGRGVVLIRRR